MSEQQENTEKVIHKSGDKISHRSGHRHGQAGVEEAHENKKVGNGRNSANEQIQKELNKPGRLVSIVMANTVQWPGCRP